MPESAREDVEPRVGNGRPWSVTATTKAPPGPSTARRIGGFFAELPVLILIAFVLALLLKTFLVQAFYIPSESMLPTLEVGDRVLVNKVVYDLRDPRRGEVVVFTEGDGEAGQETGNPVTDFFASLLSGLGLTPPGERDFIKRVIGLPGDTLEMREGLVYINGEPLLEEPARQGGYLSARDFNDFGPVEVPDGQYFMMGDNRPNSSDSRSLLGTIPGETIVGRAFVIIWPPPRIDGLPSPAYQTAAEAGLAPTASLASDP